MVEKSRYRPAGTLTTSVGVEQLLNHPDLFVCFGCNDLARFMTDRSSRLRSSPHRLGRYTMSRLMRGGLDQGQLRHLRPLTESYRSWIGLRATDVIGRFLRFCRPCAFGLSWWPEGLDCAPAFVGEPPAVRCGAENIENVDSSPCVRPQKTSHETCFVLGNLTRNLLERNAFAMVGAPGLEPGTR